MMITVNGVPVPKPRMTNRDKWQQRPCVVQYRAWADAVRWTCAGQIDRSEPSYSLTMRFYLPLRRGKQHGHRHTSKPDIDNLAKGILDAVFPKDDACVWRLVAEKYYDDGQGCRLELSCW